MWRTKMEKHVGVWLILVAVAFLLIGGLVGYSVGEAEVQTEYVDREVVKEVVKEVEVTTEVKVADVVGYRDQAVEDFMEYVDDEELFECGRYDYDYDEISISKIHDEYSVEIDDEDTTVEFSIRLKYDEDDERSCRETYDVEAYYEQDEKVEISI